MFKIGVGQKQNGYPLLGTPGICTKIYNTVCKIYSVLLYKLTIYLFIYTFLLFNIACRDSEITWNNLKRKENELELSKRMQQQYMRKL